MTERDHHTTLMDKVTVTLVQTDDLTVVTSILSAPVIAVTDSVTRKVVVHGEGGRKIHTPGLGTFFLARGFLIVCKVQQYGIHM